MKEYCKVIFETEAKDYICLWYSDLNSGFVTEENHVVCFRDEDVFDRYCRAKGYRLRETMLFDLAELMRFAGGQSNDFSPSSLLNFWNICSDLAFTLKLSFLGDDDNDSLSELYDTLFFMEAEPEKNDEHEDVFSGDDLSDLREVIADGCKLIISQLNAL